MDESPPRCSISVDIAANVAELAFDNLHAPISRITCPHSPVPLSPPLEAAYNPSDKNIVSAAKKLCS